MSEAQGITDQKGSGLDSIMLAGGGAAVIGAIDPQLTHLGRWQPRGVVLCLFAAPALLLGADLQHPKVDKYGGVFRIEGEPELPH